MEMTEYHPFKSRDAKEKYLKLYDQMAESWPIPSETQIVDTSYGKTFVQISGPVDAPPLVLLHGMGGNLLTWIPNIGALSKDYRTYAVDDIYGNGKSIYLQTVNDSNDVVNWLNELFDSLNLGNNINLMGLSYGGWQASQYALKFQNRLNKIVLLAPAGTVLSISAGFMIRATLSILPFIYFTRNLMYYLMGDLVKKGKKLAEEVVYHSFTASKCFKSKRSLNPTILDDDELRSIKIPALFLVGENEKIYSAQKAVQRINTVTPNIKTEIIPNAGHDLISVQADIINEKILQFLKGINLN